MEVLPPQDALKRHFNHHNHHANHHKIASSNKPRRNTSPTNTTNNPNNHHNGAAAARSNRKRRSSNSPPPPSVTGPVKAQHQHRAASPPSVGQIRILKRGEELPRPTKPVMARPVLGPVNGFYAGSACVTSPPPSELPLPAFFTRRSCALEVVPVESNDMQKIATDLRRALKLC